jgi:DNA repair exonuclease SbcCD ATPase subunit
MAARLTREEAQALLDNLTEDKVKLYHDIAAFREECARQNRRCGRLDVRNHFSIGSDTAVELMRIQDALKSRKPDHPDEEPTIPFNIAMIATRTGVKIDRTETEINVAFAKVAADERDRAYARYEATLAGLHATIEALSSRLYDSEAMEAELATELAKAKETIERLTANSAVLLTENEGMKHTMAEIDSAMESLREHSMALAKETIDVRTLNVSLAERHSDLVQQRDALKAEAENLRSEINLGDKTNFDLLRANSALKREVDALSAKIRFSEVSLHAAERRNTNEIAALLDAMKSLTASMLRDGGGYSPPPQHV